MILEKVTKIEKKWHQSKKFLLAAVSLLLAFLVWAASYVGVLYNATAAPNLVSLATLITGILGTIAVTGITGQSFVDVKLAHGADGSVESNAKVNPSETPDKR